MFSSGFAWHPARELYNFPKESGVLALLVLGVLRITLGRAKGAGLREISWRELI